MNYIVLMGRITTDPELRSTQNGTEVVSLTLAVDRSGKDAGTDFINIVAWKQTAVFITRYFKKGSLIAIEGALQTRSYTDRDGNKRTVCEVVVSRTHFTGEKTAQKQTDREEQVNIEDIPLEPSNEEDLPF